MRAPLVLALSALVIFLAGSAWLSLYPGVPLDLGGVADLDGRAVRVSFPVGTRDHLDGWLLRGSRPGVLVLFHGYARDHHREWRYAQFLRQDGWTVLAPDFRSAREHDRKPTTLGYWELEDARATLDWLGAQPEFHSQHVGIFGESLGGSVALVLASQRPEVAVVVVDSPFADGVAAIEDGMRYEVHVPAWPAAPIARAFGSAVTGHDLGALDAVAAMRAYGGRPLLLIQSAIEDRFGMAQVLRLEEAAGSGTKVWRVNDAGHTNAWLVHREEYESRVRAFFMEHLAPQRATPAADTVSTPRRRARRPHEVHA